MPQAPIQFVCWLYPERTEVIPLNKNIRFVICSLSVLLPACAGEAKLDRRAEVQLARHHTTCLKQGLAIDAAGHMACVAALYERERERRGIARATVAPKNVTEAE